MKAAARYLKYVASGKQKVYQSNNRDRKRDANVRRLLPEDKMHLLEPVMLKLSQMPKGNKASEWQIKVFIGQCDLEHERSLATSALFESRGNSSGKEDVPPNEPTTTGGTAKWKRKRHEDEDENANHPSFTCEEHAWVGRSLDLIDDISDNAEGHSRPNILLLGMSYPDTSSLFGGNADPSPRDVAEAVENGRMTQIDARDLVRARALEKFADVHAYW